MNWNDAFHSRHRTAEPFNSLLGVFFALAPNGFVAKVLDVGAADVVGLRMFHVSEFDEATIDGCRLDACFVSPALRACIELKTKGTTSLEQVLKYSAFMALLPTRPAAGVMRKLVLLGPDSGFGSYWGKKRYPDAESLRADIRRLDDPALDRHFRRIGTTLAEAKAGVDRLAISCLGFADLSALIARELDNVRPFTAGAEVYGKLLAGLKAELDAREQPAKRGAARAPGASAA